VALLGAYSTGALGSVIWRHPNTTLKSNSSVQLSLLADPSTLGADVATVKTHLKKKIVGWV